MIEQIKENKQLQELRESMLQFVECFLKPNAFNIVKENSDVCTFIYGIGRQMYGENNELNINPHSQEQVGRFLKQFEDFAFSGDELDEPIIDFFNKNKTLSAIIGALGIAHCRLENRQETFIKVIDIN